MAIKTKTEKIKFEIWLSGDRGKSKIYLPVLPETYQYKNGSKNTSVDIVGLGEVVVKQDPAARVISFSSYFPKTFTSKIIGTRKDKGTFEVGVLNQAYQAMQIQRLFSMNYEEPVDLYRKINDLKNGDAPVLLKITGAKINMFCTIEEFNKQEKGGDPGTIYYDITLKEYREIKVRTVKINPATKKAVIPKATARVDTATPKKTHTVKPGESLYTIAKKYTGDGGNMQELYRKNKEVLNANPNHLMQNQVLSVLI